MTDEALALFRRLNDAYWGWANGHPRKVRLGRIKYRAWLRWQRRKGNEHYEMAQAQNTAGRHPG